MTNKHLLLLGCGLFLAGLFAPVLTFPTAGDASLLDNSSQHVAAAMLTFTAAGAAFSASDRPRLPFWFVVGLVVLLVYSFIRVQVLIVDLSAPASPGGYVVRLSWGWLVLWGAAGISLFAALQSRNAEPLVEVEAAEIARPDGDGHSAEYPGTASHPDAELLKITAGLAMAVTVLAIGWDMYTTATSRRTTGTASVPDPISLPGPYSGATANTVATVADAPASDEEAAYIRDHLRLYDVNARYFDSVLDGRVPGILFKIKNGGSRTLTRVEVRIVFHDASGNAIAEEEYLPVLVSDYSFGDNDAPLRPNYIWQQDSGRFFSAKNVPSEWATGRVTATITDIEFASD